MKLVPIDVVAANGAVISVRPGDAWPVPYMGSQYVVKRGRGLTLVGWKRDPFSVRAEPYPRSLADAVRAVKGTGGSFRITSHGAVITKVSVRGGQVWEPQYVGRYEGELAFAGIDHAPSGLQRGMYWTGLPFMHGERWRVSPYAQSKNRLQWSSRGRTFSSTAQFPELIEACLDLRPRGGRIYITETGCVWMNVPDGGVAAHHRRRLMDVQQAQLRDLQVGGARATLRLLRERLEATGARPLYVGRIGEFDGGDPPWTAFGSTAPTLERSED